MRGKRFGNRSRLALLLGLDLFKEADESLRIVSRLVLVLQPEIVSLRLKSALEGEEGHGDAEAGGLIRRITNSPTDKDQRNGRQLGDLGARHLSRSMARTHMGDFV